MILTKRNCCTTLKSFLIGMLLVCYLISNNVEAAKLKRNKTPTLSPEILTASEMASINQKIFNATTDTGSTEIETVTEPSIAEEATTSDKKQTVATVQQKQTIATSDSNDATSSLSIWGIVRSVWNWIRDDLSESLLGNDDENDGNNAGSNDAASVIAIAAPSAAVEGRTFGKIRRLQMALIPIIFKFGVLSAMVAFLVVLGMKTLFLLKVLILMNAVALLGKFLTLKTNFANNEHHYVQPAPVSWGYSNWNPHASGHGWSGTSSASTHSAPSKEIHLHIHGAQTQPQVSAYSSYGAPATQNNGGWERRNDPYSAYDPASINAISDIEIDNELNNQGPISLLPTKYPANHRY